MAETITLYDQNGNETVFDKHFETKIRGVIYDIFTIQGREDEGGFVFKATPLNRHGEFNYEICMDQSIVQEVFARFRQQGGVEEEPPLGKDPTSWTFRRSSTSLGNAIRATPHRKTGRICSKS